MNRVYWDTMTFVYLLEGHMEFGPQVRTVYESITHGGDKICTSVFTVGELLVRPREKADYNAISLISKFMQSGEIELLPFAFSTAEQYGNVRASARVKPADAIHLSTAILANVKFFLTNDHDLLKLKMPGLPLMVGLDGKIF